MNNNIIIISANNSKKRMAMTNNLRVVLDQSQMLDSCFNLNDLKNSVNSVSKYKNGNFFIQTNISEEILRKDKELNDKNTMIIIIKDAKATDIQWESGIYHGETHTFMSTLVFYFNRNYPIKEPLSLLMQKAKLDHLNC